MNTKNETLKWHESILSALRVYFKMESDATESEIHQRILDAIEAGETLPPTSIKPKASKPIQTLNVEAKKEEKTMPLYMQNPINQRAMRLIKGNN